MDWKSIDEMSIGWAGAAKLISDINQNTMECWKEMLIETCIRAKDNINEDALNKKLEEGLHDGLDHIK